METTFTLCEAESSPRGTLQSVPSVSSSRKIEDEAETIVGELKQLKIETEMAEGAIWVGKEEGIKGDDRREPGGTEKKEEEACWAQEEKGKKEEDLVEMSARRSMDRGVGRI